MKPFTKAIDNLLTKLENELSDLEYISSHLWLEVIQTAKIVYDFFTDKNINAID